MAKRGRIGSEKRRLPAYLLCSFLGLFGAHRFYVGRTGTAVPWLLTGGLVGVGWLVDMITIIVGSFKDSEGKKVEAWIVVRDSQGGTLQYWT